jgi:hypothetical protein
MEELANKAIRESANIKYDFYLTRDIDRANNSEAKGLTIRDYSGQDFNKEIVATLKGSNELEPNSNYITLAETPKWAIAYCYNRNKRNADGSVVSQDWYLPAIDEIEEIQMGAYGEFDKVFQKQKYWSCQPAAFNKILRLERERWLIVQLSDEVQNGQYMDDDVDRARATSVLFDPSNPNANQYGYVNISSGTNGVEGTFTLHFKQFGDFVPGESGYDPDNIGNNKKTNYLNPDHLGNLPRTERCRIRAVYRSGTGTKQSN